jgi:hypothetical protein
MDKEPKGTTELDKFARETMPLYVNVKASQRPRNKHVPCLLESGDIFVVSAENSKML